MAKTLSANRSTLDRAMTVQSGALSIVASQQQQLDSLITQLDRLRDGFALANTACLQVWLKDYEGALNTFRKAIDAGYRDMGAIREFMEDETDGIATLRGSEMYAEVSRKVAALESLSTG